MSEFILNTGGEEIRTTPDNTRLIHHRAGTTEFAGVDYQNSRFDHLAVDMGKRAVLVLFRQQFDNFNTLAGELIQADYESILNKRSVGNYALNAYQAFLDRMSEREVDNLDDGLKKLLGDS